MAESLSPILPAGDAETQVPLTRAQQAVELERLD